MESRGLSGYVLFLLDGDEKTVFLVSVDDVRASKCGSVSSEASAPGFCCSTNEFARRRPLSSAIAEPNHPVNQPPSGLAKISPSCLLALLC